MVAITVVGFALLVLGVPLALRRRAPRLARTTAVALLCALPVTLILQLLCDRPRPDALALLTVPPLPSFPSGHAVLAAIAVVAAAGYRRSTLVVGIPMLLLVAWSRVHVGHHHPSDVVAGLVLGVGIGLAAVVRASTDPTDRWRLRWILWPQVGLVLAITLAAYAGVFSAGDQRWLRVPNMDKALHFLLFGLIALGLHLHTRGRRVKLAGFRLPVAVIVPLLGATVEELGQALSPHRTADPFDLLADFAGLLLFWLLGTWLTGARPAAPEELPLRKGC